MYADVRAKHARRHHTGDSLVESGIREDDKKSLVRFGKADLTIFAFNE